MDSQEKIKYNGLVKITDEEYFSSPAINASALKDILHTPAKYKQKNMVGEKKEPTDAMKFGTLLHKAIFETKEFKEKVIIRPKFDKRTKVGKAGFAEWESNLKGDELVLDEKLIDNLVGMLESVRSNEMITNMLVESQFEVSGFWHDEELGIDCKCKFDALTESGWIIDLKSSVDASMVGFSKQMAKLRYDISAAWYCRGYKNIFGKDPKGYVFIPVEKEPPYLYAIYKANPTVLGCGEFGGGETDGYMQAAELLRKCIELNEWPGYGEKAQDIAMPSWFI